MNIDRQKNYNRPRMISISERKRRLRMTINDLELKNDSRYSNYLNFLKKELGGLNEKE